MGLKRFVKDFYYANVTLTLLTKVRYIYPVTVLSHFNFLSYFILEPIGYLIIFLNEIISVLYLLHVNVTAVS